MRQYTAVFLGLTLAVVSVGSLLAQEQPRIESIEGSWHQYRNIDVMTDEEERTLILMESPSANSGLLFMCVGNDLRAAALIGSYMIGDDDDEVFVEYRVDSDDPVNAYWDLVSDNTTAIAPSNKKDDLIRDLVAGTGERFILRITDPHDRDSVTLMLETPNARQILGDHAPCALKYLEK